MGDIEIKEKKRKTEKKKKRRSNDPPPCPIKKREEKRENAWLSLVRHQPFTRSSPVSSPERRETRAVAGESCRQPTGTPMHDPDIEHKLPPAKALFSSHLAAEMTRETNSRYDEKGEEEEGDDGSPFKAPERREGVAARVAFLFLKRISGFSAARERSEKGRRGFKALDRRGRPRSRKAQEQ